jgi:hypothetical protein
MCLWVNKSHVQNPIREVECIKVLRYDGKGVWMTPYQDRVVEPGHGWFKPSFPAPARKTEYTRHNSINGGFIHAFIDASMVDQYKIRTELPKDPRRGRVYAFVAYARDVVAEGDCKDIVCKALYIPAFDLTGQHRDAVLDFSKKR